MAASDDQAADDNALPTLETTSSSSLLPSTVSIEAGPLDGVDSTQPQDVAAGSSLTELPSSSSSQTQADTHALTPSAAAADPSSSLSSLEPVATSAPVDPASSDIGAVAGSSQPSDVGSVVVEDQLPSSSEAQPSSSAAPIAEPLPPTASPPPEPQPSHSEPLPPEETKDTIVTAALESGAADSQGFNVDPVVGQEDGEKGEEHAIADSVDEGSTSVVEAQAGTTGDSVDVADGSALDEQPVPPVLDATIPAPKEAGDSAAKAQEAETEIKAPVSHAPGSVASTSEADSAHSAPPRVDQIVVASPEKSQPSAPQTSSAPIASEASSSAILPSAVPPAEADPELKTTSEPIAEPVTQSPLPTVGDPKEDEKKAVAPATNLNSSDAPAKKEEQPQVPVAKKEGAPATSTNGQGQSSTSSTAEKSADKETNGRTETAPTPPAYTPSLDEQRLSHLLFVNQELIKLCVALQKSSEASPDLFRDVSHRLQTNLAYLASAAESSAGPNRKQPSPPRTDVFPHPSMAEALQRFDPDTTLPKLYMQLSKLFEGVARPVAPQQPATQPASAAPLAAPAPAMDRKRSRDSSSTSDEPSHKRPAAQNGTRHASGSPAPSSVGFANPFANGSAGGPASNSSPSSRQSPGVTLSSQTQQHHSSPSNGSQQGQQPTAGLSPQQAQQLINAFGPNAVGTWRFLQNYLRSPQCNPQFAALPLPVQMQQIAALQQQRQRQPSQQAAQVGAPPQQSGSPAPPFQRGRTSSYASTAAASPVPTHASPVPDFMPPPPVPSAMSSHNGISSVEAARASPGLAGNPVSAMMRHSQQQHQQHSSTPEMPHAVPTQVTNPFAATPGNGSAGMHSSSSSQTPFPQSSFGGQISGMDGQNQHFQQLQMLQQQAQQAQQQHQQQQPQQPHPQMAQQQQQLRGANGTGINGITGGGMGGVNPVQLPAHLQQLFAQQQLQANGSGGNGGGQMGGGPMTGWNGNYSATSDAMGFMMSNMSASQQQQHSGQQQQRQPWQNGVGGGGINPAMLGGINPSLLGQQANGGGINPMHLQQQQQQQRQQQQQALPNGFAGGVNSSWPGIG
ncbi:hypothetical protein BDZ90DRAFT_257710 [Jaminaea rosea]|uniref:Uncharacterized protein n=1 Tax=Jaminaea rosea TaxID=1569628 RepID=A0A316UZB0_9BASI|nr:hypothetical protein BDZ90DRAFT_257710 [Jaminaea rosea]PWN30637.1 hypothetical protein BDZ90DRAFT_257710 [Jaminaea rosea]